MQNSDLLAYGQYGSHIISTASAREATAAQPWVVIEALADTVFAELDSPTLKINGANGADNGTGALVRFTALSLANGRRLYGQFTHIKLTSGSVVAYVGVA